MLLEIVILGIKIQEQQFTLCAPYGPNKNNPNFFENISQVIESTNNLLLSVIIVGDLNVVLDYEKDNLKYKHKNNPKAQKHIH